MPTHPIAPIGLQAQRAPSALFKSVSSYLFDSNWWLPSSTAPSAAQALGRRAARLALGALLGTTLALGAAQAQTITRFAGTGTTGLSGDGGPALNAQFNNPRSLAREADGSVLVMDSVNGRLRRISPDGTIRALATVRAQSEQLALDAQGSIFYADPEGHQVLRVNPATGVVTPVAGTGVQGFADGPAATAQFSFPSGLAFDRQGRLLVGDTNNRRIRRIDLGANTVSTVAGTGAQGVAGDGGLATAAQLNQPYHLAVDAQGRVVMTDVSDARIRRFTPGGLIETLAGTGGAGGFAGDGLAATAATISSRQSDVAIDGAGRIYFADLFNHRVRSFVPGGSIATVAGNGVDAVTGDNGPAAAAQIGFPSALLIDPAGNLLIGQPAVLRRVAAFSPPPVPPDTVFSVPAGGALPPESIGVELTGRVSALTVRATIDFSAAARSAPAGGRAGPSGPLQVFLVALVPGRLLQVSQPAVLFLQDSQARWGPLTNPVQAFARNVDPSTLSQNRLVVTILSSFDSTLLPGTEFYLGYGRDAEEMIAAGRYRGVYKVLP